MVARITEPSTSASGSHGRHFTSAFTTNPRHASSASSSVASCGRAARQLGERDRSDEPDAADLGIVVHDEHAVGGAPHVELDTVGTELTSARPERVDRVLRGDGRRAAVTQYERAGSHRLSHYEARVKSWGNERRARIPETRSTYQGERPDQTPCKGRGPGIACRTQQVPVSPPFPGTKRL